MIFFVDLLKSFFVSSSIIASLDKSICLICFWLPFVAVYLFISIYLMCFIHFRRAHHEDGDHQTIEI